MTQTPSNHSISGEKTECRADLLYYIALRCFFPLAVVIITAKVQRYALLYRPAVSAAYIPLILIADLCFLLLCWASCFLIIRYGCDRKRWILALVHLVILLLNLLLLFEHGFLLKTGSILDGYMVHYGISHRAELSRVILSEFDRRSALLLSLTIGCNLLPLLLLRFKRFQNWISSKKIARLSTQKRIRGPHKKWLMALTIVVVALLYTANRYYTRKTAELAALCRSPLPTLVFDSLESLRAEKRITSKASHHYASPPIEKEIKLKANAQSKAYNIVIIIMESTRARSTSVYNPTLPTTPFLKGMARRGRWVRNAYTVIPHTSKALVSILCGIYPKISTPIDEAHFERIPTRCLPELLKEQGYISAFFPARRRTLRSAT